MKSPRRKKTALSRQKQAAKIDLPEEDNMTDIHLLMVIAWFACNFYIFFVFKGLDLKLFGLFQLAILSIGLGFFIPIKIYRRRYTMSFYEYILLNFLALGPFFCASIILLNTVFSGPTYQETYRIEQSIRENGDTIYILEDNAYQEKAYLRTVNQNKNYKSHQKKWEYLTLEFSDGLFGIRLIKGKSLK
jgi:hypothetical protein